ncbi:aldose 1-epimerase family protein [Ruminococcus sp. OA3]|uniref:aldose 1-epimerase family protein n=1 Tax=Ruminococcus sp. OA3 TaxID=2914164 RepID=UPI001F05A66C|nr:aldose 1-epimerase family protein [Ruminococcus sp. OA3]MCH1982560.1 aldose 1-epimerase family protein [Ruminococcus sp. OA3]
MKKKELLRKVGSIQQAAFVRPLVFSEGRAGGMRAYEIKNDHLRLQVLPDKCMDISECSYKGINLSFLAKQGLIGRMDYDTHGEEGTASLMGGMLFTCGLENTCLPCSEEENYYPMHGRIRSVPAEYTGADAYWEGEDYKICVQGTMREAKLFGHNLTLSRKIETVYKERSFTITDKIENTSFREEPMMILYHFNIGYPFLQPGCEVVLPSQKAVPRDRAAEKDAHLWNIMEDAAENEPERVYLHELAADRQGNTFACMINRELGLGVKITFNKRYLPAFVQWKSLAAGDYVMGLEPTNSGVYGRIREGSRLHMIRPFEQEVIRLTVSILEGEDELDAAANEANELKSVQ